LESTHKICLIIYLHENNNHVSYTTFTRASPYYLLDFNSTS